METLEKRFKKLVLHRSESHSLSEIHRQNIAYKFANKSLQELQEMVPSFVKSTNK